MIFAPLGSPPIRASMMRVSACYSSLAKACRVRSRSKSLARSRLCLREALSRLPAYAIYTVRTRNAADGPPPDVNSFDDSKSATVFGGFARILDSNSPVWVSISPLRYALPYAAFFAIGLNVRQNSSGRRALVRKSSSLGGSHPGRAAAPGQIDASCRRRQSRNSQCVVQRK